MPCGKYERIRSVDTGRPKHHYIKIGIRKNKGKRGGTTKKIGGLREYKRQPIDYEMRGGTMRDEITFRRSGDHLFVFKDKEHMWTENLKNPLKSWGATKYRKHALAYMRKKNIGQGGFFEHPREHSDNAIAGAKSRVKKIDQKFRKKESNDQYIKTWIYTNPKTRETYKFGKKKNGVIVTIAFLGYKAPSGRLIKPGYGVQKIRKSSKERKFTRQELTAMTYAKSQEDKEFEEREAKKRKEERGRLFLLTAEDKK